MGTLRRANLTHVLIATACSSASPDTSTSITGVLALDDTSDCNGYCTEETVEGTALAQGVVWLTRGRTSSPDNGQTITDVEQLGTVTFGADAGVTILATTPSSTSGCCGGGNDVSSDVGVSSDGTNVYFAYADPTSQTVVVQDGVDGGTLNALTQSAVIAGVAAQTKYAVVGLLPSCCSGNCNAGGDCYGGGDDIYNSYSNFNINSSRTDAGALLCGLNFVDGGVTPQPIGIDAQVSTHLFTSDGTTVYWIDNGAVSSMPADFSSPPAVMTGTIVSGIPVAIAASGGVVGWTTITGANGQCGGGVPGTCFKPTNYTISTSTNGVIYSASSSTEFALGLAIDGSNAYFAIVQEHTTTNCCNNQDGGLNYDTKIYTTKVARISLTGASSQTPSFVNVNDPSSFDNARLFGPRRFLVDANFVYGIDPAYVLRIDKKAFP